MNHLNQVERRVLDMRLTLTLEECATRLGKITRQRVYQIEKLAYRKVAQGPSASDFPTRWQRILADLVDLYGPMISARWLSRARRLARRVGPAEKPTPLPYVPIGQRPIVLRGEGSLKAPLQSRRRSGWQRCDWSPRLSPAPGSRE